MRKFLNTDSSTLSGVRDEATRHFIRSLLLILVFVSNSQVGSSFPIGSYSWHHSIWRMSPSHMVSYMQHPRSSHYATGDLFVNVADFHHPDYVPMRDTIIGFLSSVRTNGNTATIYLTYGDGNGVKHQALDRPFIFIHKVFEVMLSFAPAELQAVAPLGISFACENFPPDIIQATLFAARLAKASLVASHFGGNTESFKIQWVIEGRPTEAVADVVMRNADSALMMVYRNYLGSSPLDAEGHDDIVMRLRGYMLERQCPKCLDDEYARANYVAKISIMTEAACSVAHACSTVSFCAFDGTAWNDGQDPVEYVVSTLSRLNDALESGAVITREQRERLFASSQSLFVMHDWEWFTCYFRDDALAFSSQLCSRYLEAAHSCRLSRE